MSESTGLNSASRAERRTKSENRRLRQRPHWFNSCLYAPALLAATVGIALGQNSDITSEAASAVILDSSLQKVDEFLHISRRLRTIALQSACGGMSLSLIGMAIAAAGYLPPIAGAIAQEVIAVLAVANALRMATPPRTLTDDESQRLD